MPGIPLKGAEPLQERFSVARSVFHEEEKLRIGRPEIVSLDSCGSCGFQSTSDSHNQNIPVPGTHLDPVLVPDGAVGELLCSSLRFFVLPVIAPQIEIIHVQEVHVSGSRVFIFLRIFCGFSAPALLPAQKAHERQNRIRVEPGLGRRRRQLKDLVHGVQSLLELARSKRDLRVVVPRLPVTLAVPQRLRKSRESRGPLVAAHCKGSNIVPGLPVLGVDLRHAGERLKGGLRVLHFHACVAQVEPGL